MASRLHRLQHDDSRRVGTFCVFLDYDGICPCGYRSTGKDPYGLICRDRPLEGCAGSRFANNAKFRCRRAQIVGTNGVSIHGGGIEGRLRQPSHEIARQTPTGQSVEPDLLDTPNGFGVRQQPRQSLFDWKEAHSALHAPDRPPAFSNNRIALMVMLRSTAFAIS